MTTDPLSQLTDAERRDLALCGITDAAQLQRTTPQTLWSDLCKAQSFFPDHHLNITLNRLMQLFGMVSVNEEEEADIPAEPDPEITATGRPASHRLFTKKMDLRSEIIAEHDGHHHSEELSGLSALERKHGLSSHFHAIHCSSSLLVYLGAFSVLLLVPALILLVAVPVILLLDLTPDVSPLIYLGVFILLVLPYLLFGLHCHCNVCHIRLYKLLPYPRNRNAHRFPLLGYNVSTALHILLLFWFNCPGCGTTLKLFGGDHHHGHSHHHH